ncbi:hypothetical protein, partial [Planococcus halocryophilus]|uniref:hypothetical protein n=1 Tax=Planococcus halocryophilus TaxID=1215089 RepID=UPI001F11886C
MKLKTVFSNEMPFMIQLPSGDYHVKVKYGSNGEEYELILTLTDQMYRLHLDKQPREGFYIDGLVSELNEYIENQKLENYTFMPLKSYITCSIKKDLTITKEMAELISPEDIKEKIIKPFLISEGIRSREPK